MASDMGLMPETKCYLEDGTPLIKLDDLAAQLGVPFTEAKISLQELLTERENLGFSNAGLIADPTKIHWKQ
jgi:hypothetical protein